MSRILVYPSGMYSTSMWSPDVKNSEHCQHSHKHSTTPKVKPKHAYIADSFTCSMAATGTPLVSAAI
jgi:hypothetical protein